MCLQKRTLIKEPLEIRGLCAAPWSAHVTSRKRGVGPEVRLSDGSTAMVTEYGCVCSVACLRSMLLDPAWKFAPEGERWSGANAPTLFVGEDALVPAYGSRGLIPMEPSTGWVLLPDRTPVPTVEGPYR